MSMEPQAKIRKRIPKSCRRCHRRKQRCVGFPTCSNCENAKQPCSRTEGAPSWHHSMSKSTLVHRIEVLEERLATASNQIGCGEADELERIPIVSEDALCLIFKTQGIIQPDPATFRPWIMRIMKNLVILVLRLACS